MSLDVAILPWGAGRGRVIADSHRTNALCVCATEGAVPVSDHVARSFVPGKRFSNLTRRSTRRWDYSAFVLVLALHTIPSTCLSLSARKYSPRQCQWKLAKPPRRWSGSGRVLRRLPPPQNRTCEFPRIRLKPFKGTVYKHPVDDGSSSAMDLPVTIGV